MWATGSQIKTDTGPEKNAEDESAAGKEPIETDRTL